MAGLVGTTLLPDLTPVAAEAGVAEGAPRLVYTWARSLLRSYTPAEGGAPRLVATVSGGEDRYWDFLGVWDTGTGAFLGALRGPEYGYGLRCVLIYRRRSDGRLRVAAGSDGGRLCIWDGDDLRLLDTMQTNEELSCVCLAVYEEPTSGSTRLVTG
jgi:hypothetical protein